MNSRKTILIISTFLVAMSLIAYMLIPTEPNDGKAHITWVSGNDPNKQLVAEMFNKSSKQTEVSIDTNSGGVTKTLVQCTANMGGDVIDLINEYNIQVYHSAGILMDITDQAGKYGFSLDSLSDSVKNLCTVEVPGKDGKLHKRQFTYPATVDNDFIIYNKAIFDKYNVPYPSEDLTWKEYIDIARKLTRYANDGDVVPELFGATGAKFQVILWEKEGDIYKDHGTASGLDTPQAIAALKFYHDLFFKYNVEPTKAIRSGVQTAGTGSVSSSSNHAWLGSGKVAMIWAGRWFLKELRVYADYNKKRKALWEKNHPGKPYPFIELHYGASQVPRFKNSSRYNMTFTGRTVGINIMTKNPESSLEFLSYLASPEYNRFICRISGAKPPNKDYWKPEFFYHPDYPEEKPVHDMSIKAVASGRCMQRSPFIETSVSCRILNNMLDVVSTRKNISDKELKQMAKDAASKVNAIIARNVERNKTLKRLYEHRRAALKK